MNTFEFIEFQKHQIEPRSSNKAKLKMTENCSFVPKLLRRMWTLSLSISFAARVYEAVSKTEKAFNLISFPSVLLFTFLTTDYSTASS